MTDADRREKVIGLLRDCVDKKLLCGETGLAREKAEWAFSLAIKLPEVPSPWPELAAYRLAHLMLRSIDSNSALSEIEVLLRFAGRTESNDDQPALAPHPAIYRLAVLQRLSRETSNETVRDWIESQIAVGFKQARDQVADLLRETRMVAGTENDTQTGPIQDGFFNMLEFAAYFLGENYPPLEGLGALDIGNLSDSNAWVIVGPDSQIAAVRMSRRFAMSELESRGKFHPEAVLFRVASKPNVVEWRLASAMKWESANYREIKLLAFLLQNPLIRKQQLKQKVVGNISDDRDAYFRQLLTRLQRGLRDLTGRTDMRVFVPRSNPLSFADPLILFGAVHLKTLGL